MAKTLSRIQANEIAETFDVFSQRFQTDQTDDEYSPIELLTAFFSNLQKKGQKTELSVGLNVNTQWAEILAIANPITRAQAEKDLVTEPRFRWETKPLRVGQTPQYLSRVNGEIQLVDKENLFGENGEYLTKNEVINAGFFPEMFVAFDELPF